MLKLIQRHRIKDSTGKFCVLKSSKNGILTEAAAIVFLNNSNLHVLDEHARRDFQEKCELNKENSIVH